MGREDSVYVYGDFWLDKRRDGKAPDVWQIAWYEPDTRQVRYRSTRCTSLDDAKGAIRAHEESQRAKAPQKAEDAKVVPLLFNYWNERGRNAKSASQIASSIRQFIGFLMQDEATADVTVSALNPQVFERFRKWRMKKHEYDVPWSGRTYVHTSEGVSGEAVHRNLDDIRAALNHQVENGRLPYCPKIAISASYHSPPRDRVLTTDELGAIVGYCSYDISMLRWVLLMLGTAVRPDAGLAMDPTKQRPLPGLIDLHPPAWPRTKKHNPVVPLIDELAPWLTHWADEPHKPAKSRKTAWRKMRSALGLSSDVVPKTIRHTVATRLRQMGVPKDDISVLLGHIIFKGSTAVYAKYDPQYLQSVKPALSTVWADVWAGSRKWLAVHSLSTPKRGTKLTVVEKPSNLRIIVVGADRLELPTLSV